MHQGFSAIMVKAILLISMLAAGVSASVSLVSVGCYYYSDLGSLQNAGSVSSVAGCLAKCGNNVFAAIAPNPDFFSSGLVCKCITVGSKTDTNLLNQRIQSYSGQCQKCSNGGGTCGSNALFLLSYYIDYYSIYVNVEEKDPQPPAPAPITTPAANTTPAPSPSAGPVAPVVVVDPNTPAPANPTQPSDSGNSGSGDTSRTTDTPNPNSSTNNNNNNNNNNSNSNSNNIVPAPANNNLAPTLESPGPVVSPVVPNSPSSPNKPNSGNPSTSNSSVGPSENSGKSAASDESQGPRGLSTVSSAAISIATVLCVAALAVGLLVRRSRHQMLAGDAAMASSASSSDSSSMKNLESGKGGAGAASGLGMSSIFFGGKTPKNKASFSSEKDDISLASSVAAGSISHPAAAASFSKPRAVTGSTITSANAHSAAGMKSTVSAPGQIVSNGALPTVGLFGRKKNGSDSSKGSNSEALPPLGIMPVQPMMEEMNGNMSPSYPKTMPALAPVSSKEAMMAVPTSVVVNAATALVLGDQQSIGAELEEHEEELKSNRRRAPSSIYMEAAAVNAVRSLTTAEQQEQQQEHQQQQQLSAAKGLVGKLEIGADIKVEAPTPVAIAPPALNYRPESGMTTNSSFSGAHESDRNSMNTVIDYGSDVYYEDDDASSYVRSSMASSLLDRSTSMRSLGGDSLRRSNLESTSRSSLGVIAAAQASGTSAGQLAHQHLLQHHPFLRPSANPIGSVSSNGSSMSSGYGSSSPAHSGSNSYSPKLPYISTTASPSHLHLPSPASSLHTSSANDSHVSASTGLGHLSYVSSSYPMTVGAQPSASSDATRLSYAVTEASDYDSDDDYEAQPEASAARNASPSSGGSSDGTTTTAEESGYRNFATRSSIVASLVTPVATSFPANNPMHGEAAMGSMARQRAPSWASDNSNLTATPAPSAGNYGASRNDDRPVSWESSIAESYMTAPSAPSSSRQQMHPSSSPSVDESRAYTPATHFTSSRSSFYTDDGMEDRSMMTSPESSVRGGAGIFANGGRRVSEVSSSDRDSFVTAESNGTMQSRRGRVDADDEDDVADAILDRAAGEALGGWRM
ncbi:hypothetical protein HDU97_009491 [Phlyctochytrium planicorne]|nr:hypothetical protein HDU97_009491 [Phlyctochytrium planicorne]